jgi:hypothetical protein
MRWNLTKCSRNGKKQIELYRSINIRCDDVLENLRKATPCFITGRLAKRELDSGQLGTRPICRFGRPGKCQLTVATGRVCQHLYWKLVSSLLVHFWERMTMNSMSRRKQKLLHIAKKRQIERYRHRRGRCQVKQKKRKESPNRKILKVGD